jgi:glucokinase
MPPKPTSHSEVLPSRPSHLRQVNALSILQLLRAHNPCSKADLVRLSGLSAPTVSSGIAYLEGLGLVESIGDGESSGGRPPGLLRFNAGHGYVAGVDLGGTRLRMILADLNGKALAHWSIQLPEKQKTPKAVCSLIHEGLKAMCEQGGIAVRKVLHVATGAPGITNARTGIVLSAPNLKTWDKVPFSSMLQEETGVRCSVENDTNLAAVGEHWRGVATDADNFVFIALGTGVGAGIFLEGKLYHGAQCSAGEIGYLSVGGTKREAIRVRETGQLERAIGGRGIEQEWIRLLKNSRQQSTMELIKLRPTQIFDLARDGDRLALQVVDYMAGILADAVANIALLLNPELVILGGGVGCHEQLCSATEKLVKQHEFAQPKLRSSSLGTQAQLYGAISMALMEVEGQLLQ